MSVLIIQDSIQQALAEIVSERIVITVAHRLPGVVTADVIIVMHEGQIVEQGGHAELLSMNGYYARLWHHHELASKWTLQRGLRS